MYIFPQFCSFFLFLAGGDTKCELEEIKSQVSEVKQKWRTGDLEGADVQEDNATREELEALKGVGQPK